MKKIYYACILGCVCIALTACGAGGSTGSTTGSTTAADTEDVFSERDMTQNVDVSEAEVFEAKDGETIVISEEGLFVLTGEAKNCTVRVEAGDEDKIQLVLKDLTIENEDFPAIYVVSADKCFVTTADGNSSLSVTGTFTTDGETNTDAVIFSKQDLTLNGEGSLDIICQNANGVSVKDDLRITGGTYTISSKKDAVEANDSIAIVSSIFNINSKKDGINCGDDDNNVPGWIYIETGILSIEASDDGIQADGTLQIDGGEFDINSKKKGLKATDIRVNGGTGTVNGEAITELSSESLGSGAQNSMGKGF